MWCGAKKGVTKKSTGIKGDIASASPWCKGKDIAIFQGDYPICIKDDITTTTSCCGKRCSNAAIVAEKNIFAVISMLPPLDCSAAVRTCPLLVGVEIILNIDIDIACYTCSLTLGGYFATAGLVEVCRLHYNTTCLTIS